MCHQRFHKFLQRPKCPVRAARVQERTSEALAPVSANYRFATAGLTVTADTLVIDLIISAALDGRQTHIDLFTDLLSPPAFHGTEPMITRTSNAVEKSAKRRMG